MVVRVDQDTVLDELITLDSKRLNGTNDILWREPTIERREMPGERTICGYWVTFPAAGSRILLLKDCSSDGTQKISLNSPDGTNFKILFSPIQGLV